MQLRELAQYFHILRARENLVMLVELPLVHRGRLCVAEIVGELSGDLVAGWDIARRVAKIHRSGEAFVSVDQGNDPGRFPLQRREQAGVLEVAPVANHVAQRLLWPRVLQGRHRPHVGLRVDVAAHPRQVRDLAAKSGGAHADGPGQAERPRRGVHGDGLPAELPAARGRRGAAEGEGLNEAAAEEHVGQGRTGDIVVVIVHCLRLRIVRGAREIRRGLQVHHVVGGRLVSVRRQDSAAHDDVFRPPGLWRVEHGVTVLRVLGLDSLNILRRLGHKGVEAFQTERHQDGLGHGGDPKQAEGNTLQFHLECDVRRLGHDDGT
mmetsp:Transcript_77744/g.224771  ORF Transcript_77744/g.224771 Transcript_77744/m.224771 type:complete len:321 (+) Transcript_77744:347-1309(+)